MDEESFTYATLRKIERAENTSPRLQRLEPRFWERLGEHLTKIRQAFQDQQEEDPTSRRTVVLADELRNTQRLAESIWGFREKKVVQAALAATRRREGTSDPPEHTTNEERDLYERVFRVLQQARDEAAITDPFSGRRRASEKVAGAGGQPAQAPPQEAVRHETPSPPTATHTSSEGEPAAVTAADAAVARGPAAVPTTRTPDGRDEGPGPLRGDGPAAQRPEEAQAPSHEGRGGVGETGEEEMELRLVQALDDIPLFVGLDLVDYELAKGEIGNLPRNAAESLAKRGIVRLLAA